MKIVKANSFTLSEISDFIAEKSRKNKLPEIFFQLKIGFGKLSDASKTPLQP